MNAETKYLLECTRTNMLFDISSKYSNRKENDSKLIFKLNYSEYQFDSMIDIILSCIEHDVLTFINLKNFTQISVNINQLSISNQFKISVNYKKITNDKLEEIKIHEYIIKINDDNNSEYNIENFTNVLKHGEKNAVKSIKENLENLIEKKCLKNQIEIKDFSYNDDIFWGYEIISKE